MLLGGFKDQQGYDEVGSGSSQEQTFRGSKVIEVTHLPTLPSLVPGSKREQERNTADLVLLGFSSLQFNSGTFLQIESKALQQQKDYNLLCGEMCFVAVAGTGPAVSLRCTCIPKARSWPTSTPGAVSSARGHLTVGKGCPSEAEGHQISTEI